jgi:hypothetical protein
MCNIKCAAQQVTEGLLPILGTAGKKEKRRLLARRFGWVMSSGSVLTGNVWTLSPHLYGKAWFNHRV